MTTKYIFFDWENILGKKGTRKNYMWKTNPDKKELRLYYLKYGVIDVLEHLHKKGYKLGIITYSHMNSYDNLNFLEALGISHYFSYVKSRKDPNTYKKGSSDIFLSALQFCKIQPWDAIFIGENYRNDILSSNKIGMKTIYVNDSLFPYLLVLPKNKKKEDLKIKSITELRKFL